MTSVTCPHCGHKYEMVTAYTHIRYRCDVCNNRFVIVYDGETPKAMATLTDAELRRQQVESGVLRIV